MAGNMWTTRRRYTMIFMASSLMMHLPVYWGGDVKNPDHRHGRDTCPAYARRLVLLTQGVRDHDKYTYLNIDMKCYLNNVRKASKVDPAKLCGDELQPTTVSTNVRMIWSSLENDGSVYKMGDFKRGNFSN
jgi:hypothetical protein